MRQVPRSPLSFKLQRVANVPEHPPPSTRLMSCAHIANRRLSRIIGVSTVQIVFAGNDSEGLRYGTIGTEEKYFLNWKEDEADNTRFKLDKYLLKMCRKERLIELL